VNRVVDIWSLPGPQRFFSDLSAMLRRGNNIVLRLPLNAPDRIEWGLREQFGNEGGWVTLEVRKDLRPADQLFTRFLPDAPPETLRSATSIANSELFQGHIVWLDGLDEFTWPEWRQFLEDYKHVCRAVPDYSRTMFIAPVRGEISKIVPQEDATLIHVVWNDVISDYDILIWAALRLRERGFKSTRLELLSATICKVALWDIRLARELANASTKNILNPHRILRELASSLGWNADTKPEWENGSIGTISGQRMAHSAFLYAVNQVRAMNSRIWAAQASVLLPKIEQRRLSLLPLIERYLQLPFDTGYSTITDFHDLEIGHLFFQINRNGGVDPALRRTVLKLKEIRNSLSHFRPVPVSDLMDDTLFDVPNISEL
jgi:hypothetical protein